MAETCPGLTNDIILLPAVRTNVVFEDLIIFPRFSLISF